MCNYSQTTKSLFEVILKGSQTSEKRNMLDNAAIREGFRDKLISDICFVRINANIADGLTILINQASLQIILSNGFIVVQPKQWIARTESNLTSTRFIKISRVP